MKYLYLIFLSFFSFLFADSKVIKSDEVVVDKLSSLVFLSNPDQIKDINLSPHAGKKIKIIDLFVPEKNKFVLDFSENINKSISIDLLENIKKEVNEFYKKRGYFLVSTTLLANQDISDGTVIFVVNIAKVEDIKIQSNKYFSKKIIKKNITLKKDEFVKKDELTKSLYFINFNPFRNAYSLVDAGSKYGYSNFVFDVNDRLPFRVYTLYDNTGNLVAGDSRFIFGFNWGNAFGLDHQLNYQFISATTTNEWNGHAADYIAVLPWKHILKMNGFVSRIHALVEGNYKPSGSGWSLAGRYKIPFIYYKTNHFLSAGYDFKRTNNFITLVGALLSNKKVDVSQFIASYELNCKSVKYNLDFRFDNYLSPGNMTHYNKNSYFSDQRSGAKSNYYYMNTYLDLRTYIKAFSWISNLKIQLASGKLLPTEQLSLGGATTIRGYKENELICDNGFYFKNEMRTPSYNFLFRKTTKDALLLLAFLDLGYAYDIDRSVFTKKNSPIASFGFGFRYDISTYLNIKLDYGVQLKSIKRINETNNDHSRVHTSISLAF